MNFKEKSFEYANDSIKLIMSLATGVLALTIAFLKDVIGDGIIHGKWLLGIGWFSLFLAIILGIWAILAITGSLNELAKSALPDRSIMDKNIQFPSILTISSFLIGILFIIIFALINL
jgi:hypothetical protein